MAQERDQVEQELARLKKLAPVGYAIGLHIRFTAPLVSFLSYPREWTDHYAANGYALRDPTVAWGFANHGVTRWSAPDLPDPWGIMVEAKSFGLVYGVTASCGELSSRSLGGAARSDREFSDAEVAEFAAIVARLHVLTQPPKSLTPAQAEALRLVASGLRHAAVAARLGISESALKARLISARQRLTARSTLEAIQRAKDFHLI